MPTCCRFPEASIRPRRRAISLPPSLSLSLALAQPSPPIVMITARARAGATADDGGPRPPTADEAAAFVKECVRADAGAGESGWGLAVWHYVVLTDSPACFDRAWLKASEAGGEVAAVEGVIPGNVLKVQVETEVLASEHKLMRALDTVLMARGLESTNSVAFFVSSPAALQADVASLLAAVDASSFARPLVAVEAPGGGGGVVGGLTRRVLELLHYLLDGVSASEAEVEERDSGRGGGADAEVFSKFSARLGVEDDWRQRWRQGLAGAGAGARKQRRAVEDPQGEEEGGRRVVVLSVVYSQPQMLAWQVGTFRRHITEGVSDFVVIIDASTPGAHEIMWLFVCVSACLSACMPVWLCARYAWGWVWVWVWVWV